MEFYDPHKAKHTFTTPILPLKTLNKCYNVNIPAKYDCQKLTGVREGSR